jgi:purine-binding chemotaxis protein CheW
MDDRSDATRFILLQASSRICAIPLTHVVETMRPLPVRGFSGSPEFVAGIAIIRGRATAVVDLGKLLGERGSDLLGRYVIHPSEERSANRDWGSRRRLRSFVLHP